MCTLWDQRPSWPYKFVPTLMKILRCCNMMHSHPRYHHCSCAYLESFGCPFTTSLAPQQCMNRWDGMVSYVRVVCYTRQHFSQRFVTQVNSKPIGISANPVPYKLVTERVHVLGSASFQLLMLPDNTSRCALLNTIGVALSDIEIALDSKGLS